MVITGCNDQSPEEVENRIAKSDRLASVNSLCDGIPKPNGFRFVDKQIRGNSFTTSIVFYYKFDGGREAAGSFFEQWLHENSWKRDPDWDFAFQNGSQRITMERMGNPSANYAISCSETF